MAGESGEEGRDGEGEEREREIIGEGEWEEWERVDGCRGIGEG